ncbi:MAG: cadmium resistance transporter [Planctomycetia bacterium]|nr:cadmium resistance transporter [Planctomycetia bacterium]
MLETVFVGIMLFASTNIDDIFLTMAFFADPRLAPGSVIIGKCVGIAAIVAASAAAAACALTVPHEWIALLGLAPLGLGLHRLWSAWRAPAQMPAAEGKEPGDAAPDTPAGSFVPQALSVAAITAANGGDNLGVYIPVFAQDLGIVPVYAAIFAVMTGLWCVVGRALVSHRLVAATMRRLATVLLPYVLIGLGLWILSDAVGLVS